MRRREREAVPGGDTKVCPYCAEEIKAAAIRCRFCQSDLTDEQPVARLEPERIADPVAASAPPPATRTAEQPGPAAPVEPQVSTSSTTGGSTTGGSTGGGPSRRVVLVCAALSLVLTILFLTLAFVEWKAERDDADATAASRTVRATLPDKLESVLSYDFQTFDQNRDKALAQLSPSFGKDYEDTLDTIEETARQQRRSQDAEVVAVAVLDATADKVDTLVFINRTTTTAGSDKQRILQDRANVTAVRRDGTWLIDEISFPTS